jgi:hypothetical protein
MKTDDRMQEDAGVIRDFLRTKNIEVPHMASLELAARLAGHRDLHASQGTQAAKSEGEASTEPAAAEDRKHISEFLGLDWLDILKRHKQRAAVAMLSAVTKDMAFIERHRLRSILFDSLMNGEFEILGPTIRDRTIERLGYRTVTLAVERGPDISAPGTAAKA